MWLGGWFLMCVPHTQLYRHDHYPVRHAAWESRSWRCGVSNKSKYKLCYSSAREQAMESQGEGKLQCNQRREGVGCVPVAANHRLRVLIAPRLRKGGFRSEPASSAKGAPPR